MPPYRPYAVFSENPFLSVIPDIPHYYANVPGISFIVDLLIASLAFGEILKFAGEKAKLPPRLSAILGFVLGASVSMAVHFAGGRLLQHWLLQLITALVAGAATYVYVSQHWSRGWSVVLATLVTIGILSLFGGFFGEGRFGAWISLLLIIVFFAVVIGFFAGIGRGGIAGGGGPGGGPGPDLNPLMARLDALERRTGDHATRIETVERVIAEIKGIIDDILRQLKPLKDFFDQWKNWFNNIDNRLDAINNKVAANKQISDQEISNINSWRQEIDKFKNSTNTALEKLKDQIEEGGKKLEQFSATVGDLKKDYEQFKTEVPSAAEINAIQDRIKELPTEWQESLNQQLRPINDQINGIKTTIAGLETMQGQIDDLNEVVNKLKVPDMRRITEKINATRADLVRMIEECGRRIDALVATGKRDPKDVAGISKGVGDVKGTNSGVINTVNIIDSEFENIKSFGPLLAEFLKGYENLEGSKKGMQTVRAEVKALRAQVSTLNSTINSIQEQLAEKEAAEAEKEERQAEEEILTLDKLYALLVQQSTVLTDAMAKIQKVINSIAGIFDKKEKKQTEKEYKDQLTDQLVAAFAEAKKDVGEIQLEEKLIDDTIEAMHKARAQVATHLELQASPEIRAQLTELDTHLGRFESEETKIKMFLKNVEASLMTEAARTVEESANKEEVRAATVLNALTRYVKPIQESITELEIIRRVISGEKVKVKARQERAKQRKASARGRKAKSTASRSLLPGSKPKQVKEGEAS